MQQLKYAACIPVIKSFDNWCTILFDVINWVIYFGVIFNNIQHHLTGDAKNE